MISQLIRIPFPSVHIQFEPEQTFITQFNKKISTYCFRRRFYSASHTYLFPVCPKFLLHSYIGGISSILSIREKSRSRTPMFMHSNNTRRLNVKKIMLLSSMAHIFAIPTQFQPEQWRYSCISYSQSQMGSNSPQMPFFQDEIRFYPFIVKRKRGHIFVTFYFSLISLPSTFWQTEISTYAINFNLNSSIFSVA